MASHRCGIGEAEKLGVNPDLKRTCMEIGERPLEEKSRYGEKNGMCAKGYLEKARTLFQELDIRWDLDELDKIEATARGFLGCLHNI